MFWLTDSQIAIQFETDFCREFRIGQKMMLKLLERGVTSTPLKMKKSLKITSQAKPSHGEQISHSTIITYCISFNKQINNSD